MHLGESKNVQKIYIYQNKLAANSLENNKLQYVNYLKKFVDKINKVFTQSMLWKNNFKLSKYYFI